MIRRKKCGGRCALWTAENVVAGIACAVALIVFAVMASLIHDVLFADAVPQALAPTIEAETTIAKLERLNAKLDAVIAQGSVR